MKDQNDHASVLPEKAVSKPSKRPNAKVSRIRTKDNGKSHALNLDLPPTDTFISPDLPAVIFSEDDADLIFLLEDGSYLILVFDSHAAGIINFHKYMKFFVRFVDHYETPEKKINVRFVVVYTSDIKRSKAEYTNGPMHFTVEQRFLSDFNSDGDFDRIMVRINRKEQLDPDDITKLVIHPLTKRGYSDKLQMIDQVIDAASKLKETYESDATVILSLVTTVLRNYITKEQLIKIKEMILMSPVGQMLYAEIAQKDAEMEQKNLELAQKKAELAQKEAVLAQREAELVMKNAELREKNYDLEKRDQETASLLVWGVDALIQRQMKLEDACAIFGKKPDDYTAAKAMMAGV